MKLSGRAKTEFRKLMTIAVVAGILLLAILVGVPVYALAHAGLSAARWWAGIATLVAVVGIPVAFFAGQYGARERIKGIDTVMLQNLETVLRMQAPPPPPEEGGGGGVRAAAALMTMENDEPPDPEEEIDGRRELTEFELEGS